MNRFPFKSLLNFLAKNKLFVFSFIVCLVFISAVILSLLLQSSKKDSAPSHPGIFLPSKPVTYSIKNGPTPMWQPVTFPENSLNGLHPTIKHLSDGSTEYTYFSSGQNNLNILIEKHNIVIFQSVPVSPQSIDKYISSLGKPDFVMLGSNYYGVNTVTNVYPSLGTAIVANIKTNTVLAKQVFQPISANEYRQKYGDDFLSSDNSQQQPQSNGTSQYTLPSSNPNRTNIYIKDQANKVVFERFVADPSLSVTDFTNIYGLPKWIFKGSNFYGPDARYYIYDNYGFAIITNPQTNQVLEEQMFIPMKIEDYINKFGDDIPAQP